jgi:GAF domain-containing protein
MIFPELAISEPANLDETIQTIARAARETFSADVCLIVAVNPITQRLIEPPFVVGDMQESKASAGEQLRFDGIARRTLDQRLVLLNRSVGQEKKELDHIGLHELSSLAAVSLLTPRRHKPLAVLLIGYRGRHRFDSTAQEDLKSFAAHAALTLKDTWLLHRYREVARIGQEISQNLETHEILFEKLTTGIADIINTSYFFMLAVYQPQTKTVGLYMSERGKYRVQEVTRDFPIFDERHSRLVRRYTEEVGRSIQELKQIEGTEEAVPQSLIFVPLIVRDLSMGLLSVQHPDPDFYDGEDLQILELIGNQVAQALSNLRLFKYLDELNETGQKLTQQLDSERLFQEVVDRILETTEADVVVLYPYDEKRPDGDRFAMPPYTSGELLEKSFRRPDHVNPNPDDIAWLALKKGRPVFVKDTAKLYETLGGDMNKRKGNFEEREQIKSTAALTLKIGDETVGVLFVSYRVPQRFDAPQKTLIQGLASYAAIAIRNSRLLNRSHRLARLREIDRAISKTLDLNQVLETILTEATSVVQADEAAILLYNERKKALEIKAATGRKTAERLNQKIPLERGIGVTKWVYENKKVARVGNVLQDPRWKDIYNRFSEDTISEIDVPLLEGDDVIGVINFESNKESAYSQRDEDFITNLAAQAVVAVKNAQLYEKEQRAVTEQLAMQEIEREIVSHLNLPNVLEKILEKALEVTRSTAGQVLLYDLRRNDLYIAAGQGVPLEFKEYRQAAGEGIVWEAIKQGKALSVDITDPFWEKKYIRLIQNANWELAVPILDGNEIRGAINIESETENPFTERDERLLTQLADLALIALQNAEQYEKVEKRERQLKALHNVDVQIIGVRLF